MKKITSAIILILVLWGCNNPGEDRSAGDDFGNELSFIVVDDKTTIIGKLDSSTLTVSSGKAPYTWSVISDFDGILLSEEEGETTTVSLDPLGLYQEGDSFTVTVTDSNDLTTSRVYLLEDIPDEDYFFTLSANNMQSDTSHVTGTLPGSYDLRGFIQSFTHDDNIELSAVISQKWAEEGFRSFDANNLQWVEDIPMAASGGGAVFQTSPSQMTANIVLDNTKGTGAVRGQYRVVYDDNDLVRGTIEAVFEIGEPEALAFLSPGDVLLTGRADSFTETANGGSGSYRWSLTPGTGNEDDLLLSGTEGPENTISVSLVNPLATDYNYTLTLEDMDLQTTITKTYTIEDIFWLEYSLTIGSAVLTYGPKETKPVDYFPNQVLTLHHKVSDGDFVTFTVGPNEAWDQGFLDFDPARISITNTDPFTTDDGISTSVSQSPTDNTNFQIDFFQSGGAEKISGEISVLYEDHTVIPLNINRRIFISLGSY